MMFDWTLNIGHLLTIGGMLGGAALIVVAVRTDVRLIQNEIDIIKDDLKAMAGVLVALAKQEERLNSHGHRITRLEDRVK